MADARQAMMDALREQATGPQNAQEAMREAMQQPQAQPPAATSEQAGIEELKARGIGQSLNRIDALTFGGASRLYGNVGAAYGSLVDGDDFDTEFEQLRAEADRYLENYRRDNPGTAFAEGAAAGALSGLKVGAAAKAGAGALANTGAPVLSQAGKFLQGVFTYYPKGGIGGNAIRATQNAGAGAIFGGATALNRGSEDPGFETAIGAALGPAGAAAGRVVGSAIGAATKKVGDIIAPNGEFTPEAAKIIRDEFGIDPKTIPADEAKALMSEFQRVGNDTAAQEEVIDGFVGRFQQRLADELKGADQRGINALRQEGAISRDEERFGVVLSDAQRRQDANALRRDEAIRNEVYGPNSAQMIQERDATQNRQVQGALDTLGDEFSRRKSGPGVVFDTARYGDGRAVEGGSIQMVDVRQLDEALQRTNPQTRLTNERVNPERARRIQQAMDDGTAVPVPIVSVNENGRVAIPDGRHRVKAALEAGQEKIPVFVDDTDLSNFRQANILAPSGSSTSPRSSGGVISGAEEIGEMVARKREATGRTASRQYEAAQDGARGVTIGAGDLGSQVSRARQELEYNYGRNLTGQSQEILNEFDELIAREGAEQAGVDFKSINDVRKRLTAMRSGTGYGTAERNQLDTLRRIIDEETDQAFDDGLFSGDMAALGNLKAARKAWRDYKQLYFQRKGGEFTDDAGLIIQKMGARRAEPTEIVNALFGASKVGEKGSSVRAIRRLKDVFSNDQMNVVRRAAWDAVTKGTSGKNTAVARRGGMTPQAIATNIEAFTSSQGKGYAMAKELFTDDQLKDMRRFAGLLRKIPYENEFNPSKSGHTAARLGRQALEALVAGGIGTIMGGPAGGVVSAAGAAALRQGISNFSDARAARQVARTWRDAKIDETVAQNLDWGAILGRNAAVFGVESLPEAD